MESERDKKTHEKQMEMRKDFLISIYFKLIFPVKK